MLPSSLRFTRLSIALIASLATLAFAAATAEATTPTTPPCGKKLCLELSPEPDSNVVIPNGYLIYRAVVTTPDGSTSTATKVTLTLNLDDNVTLLTSDQRCTQPPAEGEPRVDLITCELGSVKPSDTPLTFRFFVKMPPSGTTETVATLTSDARANDTGTTGGDPTEETVIQSEVVSVGTQEDLAASAVRKQETLTLDTDPDGTGATGQDQKTAKFIIFANDFFTSAAVDDDVPDPDFVCPTGLVCPGGGWIQAVIPGPAFNPVGAFIGKNSIRVLFVEDVTVIPRGLTTSNYVLIHDTDYLPGTTSTSPYELISRSCKKNPPPCLNSVNKLRDGDFVIDAQVTGNWRYR